MSLIRETINKSISRRAFLQGAGALTAAPLLAGFGSNALASRSPTVQHAANYHTRLVLLGTDGMNSPRHENEALIRKERAMELKRYVILIWVVVLVSTMAFAGELIPGKSFLAPGRSPELTTYTLDANAGILDTYSPDTGFWMLYGSKPFIWSESLWNWQPLRDVPDRLDGKFTLMPLYLR